MSTVNSNLSLIERRILSNSLTLDMLLFFFEGVSTVKRIAKSWKNFCPCGSFGFQAAGIDVTTEGSYSDNGLQKDRCSQSAENNQRVHKALYTKAPFCMLSTPFIFHSLWLLYSLQRYFLWRSPFQPIISYLSIYFLLAKFVMKVLLVKKSKSCINLCSFSF